MMDFRCLSPDEVRAKYNNTPYKKYMLGVLADLTDSSEEEVAEFLGVGTKVEAKVIKTDFHRSLDVEKARELYDQGMSDPAIARTLGVAVNTVWTWRNSVELEPNQTLNRQENHRRRMELWKSGLSDSDIARELGMSVGSIKHWRQYHHLPPNKKRAGMAW